MATKDDVLKMIEQGEAGIAQLKASIETNAAALKTSEASLVTLRARQSQFEDEAARLERGDDLRAILIDATRAAIQSVSEGVEQARESLGQMRTGLEQQRTQLVAYTNYLRMLRDSIEG